MNERFLTLTVNKVVFPNSVGVIDFNDEKVIELLKEASYSSKSVVLVPKQDKEDIVSGDIGVMADIEQFLASPFDMDAKLAYKSGNIIRISDFDGEGLFGQSSASLMEYDRGNALIVRSLFVKAKNLYEDYITSAGLTALPFREELVNSDMDAIIAKLPSADRFKFFLSSGTEERLMLFIKTVREAKDIQEIEESVQQKVKEAIDLNQREFYVREQIRALSSEIEDEDESEIYFEKIDELKADDDVKEKLRKEVRRIKRTAPQSPEMALIKNYLDTVLDLPFGIYTEDNEDLKEAQKVLDEDHHGLKKVKERLIEALAVRKLSKNGRSPIILLVGPPGIGKTSIARSIAKAMNKNYVRLSFGGVRDEAEIRGHRKTYIGAMPGRIITSIKTAGSMNPVFLMDEIDKMASDYKGDPASALLEVLDPEQNVNFRDHFVELPFDLSKVLFITTANTIEGISRPLLDRMEIIEMSGYTDEEKLMIAKKHLIDKSLSEHGLDKGYVKLSDKALYAIINNYTRESGVRGLEKMINAVMRKAAKLFVEGKNQKGISVTESNLKKYLGEARFIRHEEDKEDKVGVVNGLAYTSVGGETLSVEVMLIPGKGNITLTGSLGDVMKESANIAISYARSMAKDLNIPEEFFKSHDIHIHVPEGATPKDGPSAGVTIATAIISALSQRKVDASVAMTGEITLRGNVLPIGGLKEKSLAAVRAGIKRIYIPEDNKRDYNLLPESVKKKLNFIFVKDIKNIITGALK